MYTSLQFRAAESQNAHACMQKHTYTYTCIVTLHSIATNAPVNYLDINNLTSFSEFRTGHCPKILYKYSVYPPNSSSPHILISLPKQQVYKWREVPFCVISLCYIIQLLQTSSVPNNFLIFRYLKFMYFSFITIPNKGEKYSSVCVYMIYIHT